MLSIFRFMEVIEIDIVINPSTQAKFPNRFRRLAAMKIIEVAKFQYAKFHYATYKFGDL